MAKPRINPHDRGTAEHTLYASWRRASIDAKRHQDQAMYHATEAGAYRAKADHYAAALSALGHSPAGATILLASQPAED